MEGKEIAVLIKQSRNTDRILNVVEKQASMIELMHAKIIELESRIFRLEKGIGRESEGE